MITNERIETLARLTVVPFQDTRIVPALTAAIDTLEALPVTADGVRVAIPYDFPLWLFDQEGGVYSTFTYGDDQVKGCYSTREAAEAAKEKGDE